MMIKIVMKNETILEVDANGFREEENTIWFDNGGVNVMVVNKSEFSYCFIVDEKEEKEKGKSFESANLIQLIESENGKKVVDYVGKQMGIRIDDVNCLINFSLDSVVGTHERAPSLISKDYLMGYSEAMRFVKRELKDINVFKY